MLFQRFLEVLQKFDSTNIQKKKKQNSFRDLKFRTYIAVPLTNVASIVNNAVVIEGVSRSRNALINGDTSNYDWDNGYTCHQLGSGAIVVQLPQPYLINSMRYFHRALVVS